MKKLLIAVSVLVALVGGVALGVLGANKIPVLANFSMATINRSAEIIKSVTKEEQVVLLSLGIQGVEEIERPSSEVLGVSILGTERKSVLVYAFTAKLGIEGKDVVITELDDNRYKISVPKFIFIGYQMEPFDDAVEKNGALSWLTKSIDPKELEKRVMAEDRQAGYVEKEKDALKEQAEAFYTRIISGIDQSAVVEFEFAE